MGVEALDLDALAKRFGLKWLGAQVVRGAGFDRQAYESLV